MKMQITLTCDCEHQEMIPIDVQVSDTDPEKSISDSINEHSDHFKADIGPDTVYITCTICQKRKEFTT